jgi:hypothetical protein
MTRILNWPIGRTVGPWGPRLILLIPLLVLGAAAWGCAERITGPEQRTTSEMRFLRTRLGAPAFATLSTSFYAKRGEERGAAIYYNALPGARDSTAFLTFRVPAGSLATSPDGRAYAPRDSVLIRITITDPVRMIVNFEPSGLMFSRSSPARLELSFQYADGDFNQDAALKAQLAIWGQHAPGGLWTKMASALFLDLQELEAAIPGFSGYAAAY